MDDAIMSGSWNALGRSGVHEIEFVAVFVFGYGVVNYGTDWWVNK